MPAPQIGVVLSFVRALPDAPETADGKPTAMGGAVRSVLAWAARADAATSSRLTLEDLADDLDAKDTMETPFVLPQLSRVPRAI